MEADRFDAQVEDYHRLLAVAALFKRDFSLDWLVDLFTGKKPSQVLGYLERGVDEGWLANQGPILTRLGVDETWDRATLTGGILKKYKPTTVRGGHAVCLVGYIKDRFIVRNSWGTTWGDKGFAYALDAYAQEAFTEAYGAVL